MHPTLSHPKTLSVLTAAHTIAAAHPFDCCSQRIRLFFRQLALNGCLNLVDLILKSLTPDNRHTQQ